MQTTPTLLTLADARLTWHLYAVDLDSKQKRIVNIRKQADGGQQEVIRRTRALSKGTDEKSPRALTKGAGELGAKLIKMALTATQRVMNSSFLFDQLITDDGLQVAPIEVNNLDIAKMSRCCVRTAQNHIKELIKTGLIQRKESHGTKRRYELWINPEFVWGKAQKPVEKHTEPDSGVHHISAFLPLHGNNLPHSEFLETTGNSKVIVGDCEKLSDCPEGNPLAGNGRKQEALPAVVETTKKEAGGRAAARTAQRATDTEALAEQMAVAQKKAYCVSTWEYSKALIYRDTRKTWTAEEERKALIAIWNGVYGGFCDPNFDYAGFHDQVIRRVELVRIHFDLHPGRYAPLPYSEIHPGRGYFDAENANGFAGTRAWYLKDLARKNAAALEVALLTAFREMKQRQAFERRGEKARVPRRIKNHTLLQLHSEHYRIIGRLGGEKGLYRFAKRVEQLKIVMDTAPEETRNNGAKKGIAPRPVT